jgi:hypothetical protein
MLTTAMTSPDQHDKDTWAVLIEVVDDITDAWNGPISTAALGTVPVLDKERSVTAVAPIPRPTEPRPMATLAHAAGWAACHAAPAGRLPACRSRADPFDQPLGQSLSYS